MSAVKYFNFAERKDQSETLGEQYTLENIEEVDNIGDALGHTVVVFGYIQPIIVSKTKNFISTSKSFCRIY